MGANIDLFFSMSRWSHYIRLAGREGSIRETSRAMEQRSCHANIQ
ncbi:hypothetical protein PMIN01_08201 [Paraphaeosphaeria minitans]|uniref:Uncharacterized protein n=1 Tax=Paraphaeosphaeria minitans TaxID=565426 RepID=A0A9P6GEY6_9PLEO|nr:hypothetical protein PMIN01_08201 [Paraphaeosphaeria minitans]